MQRYTHADNSSSSDFESFRSLVPKPSVNRLNTGSNRFRDSLVLRCFCHRRARQHTAQCATLIAPYSGLESSRIATILLARPHEDI